MDLMFLYCERLTYLNVTSFDTSKVIEMDGMFNSCGSLTVLDLSSFSNTNLTVVQGMFTYCCELEKIYANPNKWSAKEYD